MLFNFQRFLLFKSLQWDCGLVNILRRMVAHHIFASVFGYIGMRSLLWFPYMYALPTSLIVLYSKFSSDSTQVIRLAWSHHE